MHYFEKSKTPMCSLTLNYNAGAMYEEEGKYGTMHLMEHLICKRIDDLQDKYTNLNIEWNASTNAQQVVIFINGINSALTEDIKLEFVKRLTDGIFASEDEFNKEKNIVLQEYYNCFNDIQFGNLANYFRTHFNNYYVLGKAEDIENFTYEDACNVFEKFFKLPTDIVEVDKTKSDFSFVEFNNVPLTTNKLRYKKDYNNTLEVVPETDINWQVFTCCKKVVSNKDYPIMRIITSILSDGLNSVLYQELREKRGLIYGISPLLYNHVTGTVCGYSVMTTPENAEEVVTVIKDVFNNLDKYITESRFNDVINCLKIQLDIDKIYNYSKSTKYKTKLPSRFKTKSKYDKLTLEDVLKVANKYFKKIDISVL